MINIAEMISRAYDIGVYPPYKAIGLTQEEEVKLAELFYAWNPREEDSGYNFWKFTKYRDGVVMVDRDTWRYPHAVDSFDAFLAYLQERFESNSINRYFHDRLKGQ